MAFAQRVLSFSIQIGEGSFGGSGFNTVQIPPGLWASAAIHKMGSPSYNEADIEIVGLPLDLMNQISNIGLQASAYRNNLVTVMAGDDEASLSTVFVGGITNSWPDFANPTEAVFKINANTGRNAEMKPVSPISYTGSTDVATIMGTLAQNMGFTLENNGVSGINLANPYLSGSARSQALSVADAADIYVYFEDDNGVMVICPKGQSRTSPAPTISPLGGMVGYPGFVGPGMIRVATEYNEQLRFLGNVVIENSDITNVNGTWRVFDLRHELSTRPNGPWFSYVTANNITSSTDGSASS